MRTGGALLTEGSLASQFRSGITIAKNARKHRTVIAVSVAASAGEVERIILLARDAKGIHAASPDTAHPRPFTTGNYPGVVHPRASGTPRSRRARTGWPIQQTDPRCWNRLRIP